MNVLQLHAAGGRNAGLLRLQTLSGALLLAGIVQTSMSLKIQEGAVRISFSPAKLCRIRPQDLAALRCSKAILTVLAL